MDPRTTIRSIKPPVLNGMIGVGARLDLEARYFMTNVYASSYRPCHFCPQPGYKIRNHVRHQGMLRWYMHISFVRIAAAGHRDTAAKLVRHCSISRRAWRE